jgi:mono/diheme cytochrome c family protein
MIRAIAGVSAVFGIVLAGSLAVTAQSPTAGQAAVSQPAAADAPTYSKDVAPILYKHCTACHRPGEIAPMSLLTYEEARPWARAIRENVASGTMPPWHADPAYGKWSNDRRLSDAEKDVISRWVAAGAPQGNPKDLPAKPIYADGWGIGQPDLIAKMETAFEVPAAGTIPYQYFEVPTNLTEDKWVEALEVRAGDRSVVHHVLVYVRHPGMTAPTIAFKPANPPGGPAPPQEDPSQLTGSSRPPSGARRGPLMTQVAPGTPPTVYAPGTGLLLRAGSVLTFQIHYTTNGKATSDRSMVGFRFAKERPSIEARVGAMMNPRFMIPAGAENHAVEAGVAFAEDVTIYGLIPHTHLRGKSWSYTMTWPDGKTETILAVPKYDFDWQTEYMFATPLRVPKGSVLKSVATYDNSKNNKSNPDPTKDVYWGDQTWEEMQYTGINFSIDKDRTTTTSAGQKQ